MDSNLHGCYTFTVFKTANRTYGSLRWVVGRDGIPDGGRRLKGA